MGQPFTTPEHFGYHLSTLLQTHKLSVSGLAEATRLEPDFIVRLLHGEQILTADVALLFAEVFGGSPLALLEVQRDSVLELRESREKTNPIAA